MAWLNRIFFSVYDIQINIATKLIAYHISYQIINSKTLKKKFRNNRCVCILQFLFHYLTVVYTFTAKMALFFFFLSLYLPVASLKKIVSCDISICLCINSLPALLNPILSLSSLTRSRVFCLSRSITGRRTRLDVIWPWWTRRRKNKHRQESSTSQAESINTSRTFSRSMT